MARPTTPEAFAALAARFVAERYALDPVAATAAGVHDHDHRMPDLTGPGFGDRDAFVDRWIAELETIPPQDLGPLERTDRALLLADLRGQQAVRDFARWRRDPGLYSNAVIRGAYYALIRDGSSPGAQIEAPQRRDRAPGPERGVPPSEGRNDERLARLVERLAHAGDVLAAARENIDPDRTPPVWVVVAGEQASAGATFVRAVLPSVAPEGSDVKRDLLAAGKRAGDALDAYAAWLRDDLMRRARGTWAVGVDVFERLLKERDLTDHDRESLQRFGGELYRETNLQITEAARALGDTDWRDSVVRIRADHPSEDELVATYRHEMERSREATRRAEIATFPEREELVVEAMPDFARPTAPYALYVGAGAFEAHRRGRFWVSLPPSADPANVRTERLEGHPRAGIPVIACHEGYPGHHMQLSLAADHPSIARKAVRSNLFVEGWGLYIEELMTELGYLGSPETRLLRLKDVLWRAARLIVDVGLSTGSMTFEQAVSFMTDAPKPERPNAIAEVRRYTYDPLQPSSYALGRATILELRQRARRRGFGMRQFHDTLLSAGSLPPKLLAIEVGLPD
ncbi:MAG: DUF885 domain-containing protein [Chloroflexi bacterium]|nr:DUF885 domain-containing protein [Chloroflexota bacterium]